VRASAYDLGVEWYFAPQSLFSVALFQKNVKSFPVGQTRTGVFADTGLPLLILPTGSPLANNPNQQITIQTQVNGSGAKLEGLEVQLQMPFRFLPGFLRNFGLITNATFIRSNANYTVIPPSTTTVPATGSPGGGSAIPVAATIVREQTFFGLSKRTFNATLYYEDDRFSARTSASYRSRFIDDVSATGNMFEGFNSTINIDASVRYRLTKSLEVSLEGINLTDEYRDRFTDVDANRNYEYNHFGRTILFGVRYKM
jgi:TonB-dependent receptor